MPTVFQRVAAAAVVTSAAILCATNAHGQSAVRFAIMEAAGRGASTATDRLTLRNATRSTDVETARLAIRTLGQIERVSQIPVIVQFLRSTLPEVRAEAANAIAQAAQGFRSAGKEPTGLVTLRSTQDTLILRLETEGDANVRAALCEALARLPYTRPADVERAEAAIVSLGRRDATSTADRLGAARGLEALLRIHRSIRPAGPAAIETLKTLLRQAGTRESSALLRDARVRRLALEGLTSAGALDDEILGVAAVDPDAQVRRLAIRGAAISGAGMWRVPDGLLDPVALVRLEALRTLRSRADPAACDASIRMAGDSDLTVTLVAIDQLEACGDSPAAMAVLARAMADESAIAQPRGWHRSAHALLALALAAPESALPALARYAASPIWQVRVYAARAAVQLKDRTTMQTLATDPDIRVANLALAGLGSVLRASAPVREVVLDTPSAADLRRLAAPRAVINIRDVGRIELALFTAEAPASVLRFAQLAESGYYNGLSFDRIAPNAIVQAGRSETTRARYPRLEVGTWPHVRGVVALSMPDTDDGQFFFNMVDNPRFDHRYTVFAQILNGADVVDRILEGDVIESIAIIP